MKRTLSALIGVTLCAGCMSAEPGGIAKGQKATTTVKMDFLHRPLPEIPLPNDVATRHDPTSPTGRRVNASMVAPTQLERRVREKIDQLDGWGVLQPISIPFTGPLSVESILKGHSDKDYDLKNDVVYLIDVDPTSPDFGTYIHLDVGNGNYPVVLEDIDGYWKNDPRGKTISVVFEETDEDTNGNGKLDDGEDTDLDGVLDKPNYLPGAKPDPTDLAARSDALMTFYERETHTLLLRPMIPLRERTTYAVVVTRRLLDEKGRPVGSPYPFVNHASQTDALSPVGDLLGKVGLGLDDVAFAFTFTTQTTVSDLVAVREGLYGKGVQAHIAEETPAVFEGFELLRDKASPLFEKVKNQYILYTEDFIEGMEAIVAAFLGGGGKTRRNDILLGSWSYVDYQVVASYVSPQLFERWDEEGNLLPLDAQSWPQDLTTTPAKVRPETVYVHLLIPRKEVSARGKGKPAPVVFLGHGYTGSRFDAVQIGPYLARHGLAVASIDCVSHGLSLSADEKKLAKQILDVIGLGAFLEAATERGRSFDQNNDGSRDSGGDFWTSYVFHTRDVVRQSALDYMQLARVLRSFDGKQTWEFDLNGDGKNELAGDFDGDGVVDIGGDAPMYFTGGSLGGIMAIVAGAIEPAIKATAPIAGGGGFTDIGNRSKQGGVREALTLRVMGPLFLGTQGPDDAAMTLETIVTDVNDDRSVGLGTLSGVKKGDTVVAENLKNGERGCGLVWEDDGKTLRFRVAVESDVRDPIRLSFYSGAAVVTGSEHCEVRKGKEPREVVDKFLVDTTFHGKHYDKGTPLVAFAEGLGLRRANPELRRFMGLGQLVLDPADPAVLAPHLLERPLEYPLLGEKSGAHSLIITTIGDMNVPANSGVTAARAAGLVDYLTVDSRYGVSVNQKLIETHVVEAVDTLNRYKDPSGKGVHLDVDDFAEGKDLWGADIPRLDPPVRAGMGKPDALGGRSAAVFPYSNPTGQHGFAMPGEFTDAAIKACTEKCKADNPDDKNPDCGCENTETFDIGSFMMNMIGRFFASEGKTLDADLCQSRDDCGDVKAPPAAREKAMP
ncbi:MAG: hypothetical protein AMXMBFR64_58140 [Myxococcales bacterium]